ncbi:MAG: hypothetical protein AAGF15_08630 [Pseudomonadota bacterium]
MADAKMSDGTSDADTTDADQAGAKSSKLPLIIGAVLGLLIGGGGAAGYFLFLTPKPENVASIEVAETEEAEPVEYLYVSLNRISGPMLTKSGRVLGYVSYSMEFAVETPEKKAFLDLRGPELRHVVNQVLSQKGSGAEDNPRRIDFAKLATFLKKALNQHFHDDVIAAVNITQALPL